LGEKKEEKDISFLVLVEKINEKNIREKKLKKKSSLPILAHHLLPWILVVNIK
jgi:hypothetical protein